MPVVGAELTEVGAVALCSRVREPVQSIATSPPPATTHLANSTLEAFQTMSNKLNIDGVMLFEQPFARVSNTLGYPYQVLDLSFRS